MADIDVLGLGAVAVDDFVYVDVYPQPDAKAPVLGRGRHIGGLAATALVAAARLGARTAYAGVLGKDELSHAAVGGLADGGIDLRYLVTQSGARPIHSTIIVGQHNASRNIFFDTKGVIGAHPHLPDPAVIQRARVLLVDNFGVTGMLRAARVAHAAGIPVVADFEDDDAPGFGDLLALVDHLILSQDFAMHLTHAPDAASAVGQLWNPARQVVIVTAGAAGLWYRMADAADVQHYPAFPVNTVDSTGCGDVFHGAYAAGLASGLGVPERIRIAAAAAAIKATTPGGQAGIPDRPRIEAFLEQRSINGLG